MGFNSGFKVLNTNTFTARTEN